jgi:hypothetical protein
MAINASLRIPALVFLIATALHVSGCAWGLIYTDVTTPFTRNMDKTPSSGTRGQSGSTLLSEPLTGAGVRAEWASYGIGDAALSNGLTAADFADVEYISILGGLYQKTIIQVYGK